jgi:hypothetical protein
MARFDLSMGTTSLVLLHGFIMGLGNLIQIGSDNM